MVHFVLLLAIINLEADTVKPELSMPHKNYTGKVIFNGAVSLGLGIGAAVFYTMGNKSYADYQSDSTIKSTIADWNKTLLYDNIRNVCAVGAAVFLLRAVYYQLKNVGAPKTTGFEPIIDFEIAHQPRLVLGVNRHL